jgi:ketosteroid isomerase-like protein
VAADAIVRTYEDYFRAFQTLDPQAVLSYYHAPCLFLSPHGVVVAGTVGETQTLLAGMMKGLQARGYAKSRYADLHVKRLSESAAMLSTRVVRLKSGEEELERFGATYTFRRIETGWKIVVLVIHDTDGVLDLL